MVAVRNADIDAFVARPDAARSIVLIFGPDAGLVSERAETLVRSAVDSIDDPFALVRLNGDELAGDPARLVDEASTVPLFGGRRAIWIKAGSRDFAPAVQALVTNPPGDCRIVIEAGDLRRNAPLRVLGERSPAIAAIACYVDGDRELTRLIEDEMRSAGLSISADAKSALLPLLGADRRASRNEVRKLALYAHGKSQVDVDDVFAVVADASALALDAVVDAAFAGRAAELETHYAKARDAGIAPTRILSTAQFQVSQLHRARIAADSGTGLAEAAEQIVSRAQFRRKALIETALKSWSAPRLERAMAELANATLETRKLSGPTAELADPVVSRTLLAIATMARQRK